MTACGAEMIGTHQILSLVFQQYQVLYTVLNFRKQNYKFSFCDLVKDLAS